MLNKLNVLFFRCVTCGRGQAHRRTGQMPVYFECKFRVNLFNDSRFIFSYSSDSSTLQRHQTQMAPSVCETSPKLPPHNAAAAAPAAAPAAASASVKCGASSLSGSLASYKMAGSEQSWPQAPVYSKENQRPPVYNAEDYVLSLRKFTKGSGSAKVQSIYDVNINGHAKEDAYKAATLPAKHSGYK